MTLSQRLALLKKESGLTTDALSALSGVPKGTINKILNGETTNPRSQTLRALARALSCPPDVLMDMSEIPAPKPEPLPENAPSITVFGESVPVPLPEGDLAIRMPDDSMSASRIHKGDLVLIKSTPAPDDGSIAALILDDAPTLRRLYRIKDGLTLMSENPAFPPVVLTGPAADELKILGQAITLITSL